MQYIIDVNQMIYKQRCAWVDVHTGTSVGGGRDKVRLCGVKVGAAAGMKGHEEGVSVCGLGSLTEADGGVVPPTEGTVTRICSSPARKEKHTTPGALFAEGALRSTEQSRGEERMGRGRVSTHPPGLVLSVRLSTEGKKKGRETRSCGTVYYFFWD